MTGEAHDPDPSTPFRYFGPHLPIDGDDRDDGEPRRLSRHLIVYLGASNAATYDRPDHPAADHDGHLVAGTVLSLPGGRSSMTPVQARVAHGVAPAQAASMLRKMADLIDQSPDLCRGEPGEQARRTSFGGVERTRLTPEGVRRVAASLPEALRHRMAGSIERLIRSIAPDRP